MARTAREERLRAAVRWLLVLVLAMSLAMASTDPATAEDPSALAFDLGGTGVIEHTARIIWNLKTTNIVHPDVSSGWNSSYLQQPGSASGQVLVDLDARSITGTITETWTCGTDCQGWTTRKATLVATIKDGRLEPAATGWTITGSVAVEYKANGSRDELPSDCGGTTCYICEKQICEFDGEIEATTGLKGTLSDDTLQLSFEDGLKPNVDEMDFSALTRTEFFMSRFSITVAGASPVDVEVDPQSSADEVPVVGVIPGVDAGSPPNPDDDAAGDEASAGAEEGESAADSGGVSATGLLIALILLASLLAGVGLAIGFFRSWLARKAREGDLARTSPGPPPAADRSEKTYEVGAEKPITYQTTVDEEEPPPPPPPPATFTLVGTKESGYKYVEGRNDRGQAIRYSHGTEVEVIERKGALAKVKAGDDTMWVDRRDLQMKPGSGGPPPPPS